MMRLPVLPSPWLTTILLLLATAAQAQPSFIEFESGHVRPIALSPNGLQLFAVNTPDNRLEIFDVAGGSLTHTASIPVGMEPVSVAARTNDEIWVVNHLSDSVSIIDLTASPAAVVRTLLVGDEPRDIVFAGTTGDRAFITTAHRGQHRTHASISGVTGAGDPQLTTEGVGRADVWVFDATSLGTTVGGTPVEIVTFFADTPRALAVSPDGNTVYAAAFHSGNQSTVILETLVPDGFDSAAPSGGAPGGVPGPNDNGAGALAPETGVIVKFDGANWKDSLGRNWDSLVKLNLPDHDVFSIDANTLAGGSVVEFDHVGTILFNIAVNPVNGKLYVTNTDLPNHIRFEGAGDHGGSTVQGRLSESRITVIDPSGPSIDAQHLNQHIDYSQLHTDSAANHALINGQIQHSLATPLQPIVSSDGGTMYVAAFGSGRVGVFNTADIEDPSFETNFDPTAQSANYISTGDGPSGLVLDEANNRLYVLTRFQNQVEVVDLSSNNTVETHALNNPEPQSVVDGRPFLYNADITSGNGEASCSSCHIFADFDSLSWNLGDPDGGVSTNNQPSATPLLAPGTTFHPMKGPMTTQTLRGLATHGGMHWRGDRVDGFFGTDLCTEPTGAPCDEDVSFRNFIVAFEGLVGKEGTVTNGEMQQFTDFILQVMLPPNPVANLDGTRTASQQNGFDKYFGPITDTVEDCNGCHDLDGSQGFFGSGGSQTFEGLPQHFKVAHLRNMYQKVGMFGQSGGPALGDQVRGVGFLHDGSIGTLKNFVASPVFNLTGTEEDELEQFMLAFPSDLAPIVGQQVTLTSTNGGVANPRINLLIARSSAPFTSLMLGGAVTECDLVAKGSEGGVSRGWVRLPGGLFQNDIGATATDATLRSFATSSGPLTYTCVPPGSGERIGIDRDEDSAFDGLDNCPDLANGGQANFDGDALGDDCDPDDDNDALLDAVETNTGTFVGPGNTGTNPFDADSDGDGFDDGDEVAAGSDPSDPSSVPTGSPVPALPLGAAIMLAALLLLAGRSALRRREVKVRS